MKNLKTFAGFTRVKQAGPVLMYSHKSGKLAVVTRSHDGSLIHQDREVKLAQLVTRKKLVTKATAEKHFAASCEALGIR